MKKKDPHVTPTKGPRKASKLGGNTKIQPDSICVQGWCSFTLEINKRRMSPSHFTEAEKGFCLSRKDQKKIVTLPTIEIIVIKIIY